MEYLEINGWKFYFHSCFLTQLAELQNKVLALKKRILRAITKRKKPSCWRRLSKLLLG